MHVREADLGAVQQMIGRRQGGNRADVKHRGRRDLVDDVGIALIVNRQHEGDHAEQSVEKRVAEHQQHDTLSADRHVFHFEAVGDVGEVATEGVVLVRVDPNLLEAFGESAEGCEHLRLERVDGAEPAVQRFATQPVGNEREPYRRRDDDERARASDRPS